MNVWYVNSILGTFRLEEENDAICGLTLCPDGVPELEPLPRKVCETPLLQEAEEQLNEYFAGVRREFDLPLAARARPFSRRYGRSCAKFPTGRYAPTVSWRRRWATPRQAAPWAAPATATRCASWCPATGSLAQMAA